MYNETLVNLRVPQYNLVMIRYITKSRLLTGRKCPKRLWLQSYHRDLAQPSSTSQLTLANGIEIGAMARIRYPGGILIGHAEEPDLAVAETAELTTRPPSLPLFEAAFVHTGALVRSDILVPTQNGWRMIEVKSSGSVKDHHLMDCAIQLWVLEGAGLTIDQICVAHVETGFVYEGYGDFEQMIIEEDVTKQVRALLPEVPEWLVTHCEILLNPIPEIRMGSQCKDCSFAAVCREDMPEYPVSILPRGGKLITELQDAGIEDLRDIPEGLLKNERHQLVRSVTLSQQPYISAQLKSDLDALPYPRFYLDFETINFVIPRWSGTHPHQQLPFQWSCHIERANGTLEHHEFLDTSGIAPMYAFAESLIAVLFEDGPVIAYGTFESTTLKGLIDLYPDLESSLNEIIDRLVNLLPMLQNHYYHPAMKGKWSIKAILPTVVPHLDYSQLEEVQNGTLAQLAYLDIINPDTDPVVRDQKIVNLLQYCKLDTQAMVEVVRTLCR
jgi:CRISPR/Cas system-associated exonuclease Cas4 (RecB family)